MQGSVYVADFEVLSFFVLLFISIYMRVKYSMTSEQNREFLRIVVAIAGATFFDIFGAYSIRYDWHIAVKLTMNSLYFYAAMLTAYVFLMYVFSFYYHDDRKSKIRAKWFNQIFFLAYLALLVINLFTGIMFRFEGEGGYSHGPLFFMTFIISAFFFIQALIFILMHRKCYSRAERILLTLFSVGSTLWPVLQSQFFPTYLTNFFIGTIMMLLILFTIETPDAQELVSTINKLKLLKEELERKVEEENRLLEDREKRVSNLTLQMMAALTKAVDAKDRYTSGHSSRVAYYSRLLAGELHMSLKEQADIYKNGLLHDIGKIGVPNSIINKPGRLTDEEYEKMKSHPVIGSRILSRITLMPEISKGARWHHERPDGKGYPDHLKGDELPLEAKIIAVADSYDAMTSFRSYRGVMPQATVRAQIVEGKGTQFDPEVADAMIRLIDRDTEYKMREPDKLEAKALA